ncbi:MAG: MEDS domain-containing protein [Methanomassiliicoccales archaeon]
MPPGEKAALFYHRLDEVCGVVTELLKDSIRQSEMCVFMFRSPTSTLKEMVKARGLDLDAHPSIVLVPLSKAPVDRYSRSSIGEQMRTFVQQAKGLGYAGARLILNVPEELSAQVPSDNAWSELDKVREELGMTVVCLYDMTILSPGFLLRSLSSYPNVIMDGVLCRNFYYMPGRELPHRDAYLDLSEQLESIREERDIRQHEDRERSKLMEMNRELQGEMMQRRMVEFALLRAENNLRTMLDAMADMVFMVDRDLLVTNGNQTFVRYLESVGVDPAYEGRFVYDLFPGASTSGRGLFDEVFHHGYPTVVEDHLDLNSGRLEMEFRLMPVKMGDKVDRVVVIGRPMNATAAELKEMWEKADQMKDEILDPSGPAAGSMEFCPHPVLVTGYGGTIILANKAMGRELGCSREEVLRMGSATEFLETQRDEEGMIRRISVNGRISIPSILNHPDGTSRKVMCYVTPVGEGEGARFLTVITASH